MSDDVKPWDLLNPNKPRSSEELAVYRLEICKACDWFRMKSSIYLLYPIPAYIPI